MTLSNMALPPDALPSSVPLSELPPWDVLPADAPQRVAAHDELHARPVTPIALPAMVTQFVLRTDGIPASQEIASLRRLAASDGRELAETDTGRTLALDGGATLAWEHHADYSVYTVHQPMDAVSSGEDCGGEDGGDGGPDLLPLLPLPADWLAGLPGRTLSAVHLLLLDAAGQDDGESVRAAQRLLGPGRLLGSKVKDGTTVLFTTYRLRRDRTSRFVAFCTDVTEGRAGRIAASLLDAERYRMLALLGYPPARRLVPRLDLFADRLSELTCAIEDPARDDRALLDDLIALAAQVEAEIAGLSGLFDASLAYFAIAEQRVDDLRGTSLPGLMGVFTFLRRRLLPAMATVESVSERMGDLSRRVARAADLLRTRVEVATETQTQDLLRELRRGQSVQLRLQETVEGLSIAAISYYVVGLVGYVIKGLKAAGIHLDAEVVTAGVIPVVVAGVWLTLRRVKRRVHGGSGEAPH